MLVVIAFHVGDKPQAIALANWIKELGQVSDHKCLLCIGEGCDATGVIEPLHECFKSTSVYLPHAKAKRGEGIMGYARAANAMWQSVAWKIFMQDKCPWLWLEPDAIPTRPTWLREIEDEYRALKKPFMGAMGQCQIPMINGVAVYPPSVCDYAPLALQAAECPWDLNAAEQILKYAHVTDLFQHIYQIEGQPPTFPKNADRLNQSAALFHRSKDETLISYLKEHGYTKGKNLSGGLPTNVDAPEPKGGREHGTPAAQPARAADRRIPTEWQVDQGEEGLGEPLDYSKRLEEFDRTQTKPRIPNEGERNGDLVWSKGKWHTAPMMTEKPDRRAIMEKFAHPETDLSGGLSEPKRAQSKGDLHINKSADTRNDSGDSGGTSSLSDEGKDGDTMRPHPSAEVGNKLPAPPAQNSLPVPVLAESQQMSATWNPGVDRSGEVQESTNLIRERSGADSCGGQTPSREDVVKEAVSVLKKLCSSPRHTSQIRKELKKQKVIK